MKIGLYLTLGCTLLLPCCGWATTLRLATDVELLVLDGKKVSSFLLKGADGIELDNGPHQLVFRIEKNVRTNGREQRLYLSAPLVVSFDTKEISQVNFSLPRLENEKDSETFDNAPRLQLLDGSAVAIPMKMDVLAGKTPAQSTDYEVATRRYNKAEKVASMPQFAVVMADDSTLLSRTSELDSPARPSDTLTEQRLKYWFMQADKPTRERFLLWAKEHPSP